MRLLIPLIKLDSFFPEDIYVKGEALYDNKGINSMRSKSSDMPLKSFAKIFTYGLGKNFCPLSKLISTLSWFDKTVLSIP